MPWSVLAPSSPTAGSSWQAPLPRSLAGSLAEMKQLGFALCFGVLLDTFVVRTIIVPAFLILQRTGKLSPVNWFKKQTSSLPALESTVAAWFAKSSLSSIRKIYHTEETRVQSDSGNTCGEFAGVELP